MIELNGNLEDMLKELRLALSQVKGVKSINENMSLVYVVAVADESQTESVEAVGSLLATQARRFGFEIEVLAFTEEEIKEASTKVEESIKDSVSKIIN